MRRDSDLPHVDGLHGFALMHSTSCPWDVGVVPELGCMPYTGSRDHE